MTAITMGMFGLTGLLISGDLNPATVVGYAGTTVFVALMMCFGWLVRQ